MHLVLLAVLLLVPAADWTWPLGDARTGPGISRQFDPPATEYGPGHRGIDLPGRPGDGVTSVAGGTVTFAGRVGGVPTVTVTHGAERSTYQPVEPVVQVGDAVAAGDRLGTLTGTRLNLGRLRGETYLDPADRLRSRPLVRLVTPDGPPPPPPAWSSGLAAGLGGRISSGFGWRTHPILGTRKFHDGVDIAAACGTPVPVARGGVVTRSGRRGGYGLQVEVRHADGTRTSYSHLSRRSVRKGERVTAGQRIGEVGSTGQSTGCHLHLMKIVRGTPVDPM